MVARTFSVGLRGMLLRRKESSNVSAVGTPLEIFGLSLFISGNRAPLGSSFFGQFVRFAMISDPDIGGRLVVVRVLGRADIVAIIVLVNLIIEIISFSNVINAEYVLSSLSSNTVNWFKGAISEWFTPVAGIVLDEFVVALDRNTWCLPRNEIGATRCVLWVYSSNDMGNDVEVHGVACHSEDFSLGLRPGPSVGLHALGLQGFMAAHAPASLKEPIAIGPTCEEASNIWLASGGGFDTGQQTFDFHFVRAAFIDVQRAILVGIKSFTFYSADFGLNFVGILDALSFVCFTLAKWHPFRIIIRFREVEDALNVHVYHSRREDQRFVGSSSTDEVSSRSGLWCAEVFGVKDAVV